jgi:hypothetical protein
LLGAFFPKTDAGTIVGKPASATVPAVALIVFFKKVRLLLALLISVIILNLSIPSI